jgi:HEAT repeat protein
MKITWRKFCVFVLLAILIFAGVEIWSPLEPRYEGRRLSEWARDVVLPDEDSERVPSIQQRSIESRQRHDKAVAAIQHIGVRALPTALKLCQAKDFWIQEKLEDWAEARNLQIHLTSAQDRQIEGATIIEVLGPTAKPIIPDLIKLFRDEYPIVADEASFALHGIGPEAIPSLMEAFTNSDDPRVQLYAAYSLELFGSQAREAVPTLVSSLQNKGPFTCNLAAQALGRIGEDASIVVPALAQCLQRETNRLPLDVYRAIERFGTNAQPAIPTLVKIIESRGSGYLSALSALHKINPSLADSYFKQLKIGSTNQPMPPP